MNLALFKMDIVSQIKKRIFLKLQKIGAFISEKQNFQRTGAQML